MRKARSEGKRSIADSGAWSNTDQRYAELGSNFCAWSAAF